jgi:hypothetical protein
MNVSRLLLLGAVAIGLAACGDDGPTSVQTAPQSYVRFINAARDTGVVDLVFVDKVENLPTFFNVPFRGVTGYHLPVNAGNRQVRLFASVDPNHTEVPTPVLIETALELQANKYYTLMAVGEARKSGAEGIRLVLMEDVFPAQPAEVGVRLVHAATGVANVDAYVMPDGSTGLGSPVAGPIGGVAFLAASQWVTVPATAAGTLYRVAVTPAGSTTIIADATPNLPGAAAAPPLDAVAGVRVKGSLLTAFVVPGAIPGSRAATASNTTPSVVLTGDRNPARASQ